VTDADRYFAMESVVARADGVVGRYVEVETDAQPVEFVPGLVFRPVVGDRLMVNFVHYEPNTEAPVHAHQEEQITFVIDGAFQFDLDGDVRLMRPGTAVVVPPGVPHGAKTLDEGCYEIDVFVPPRKVLLEAMRAAAKDMEAPAPEPELRNPD
jgi:quercetin dioxygenase-like cupin family protein